MNNLYATLSLTESQEFQALGILLQSILPLTCQITRGALNRVPEPLGADFVTMMQIGQKRLAWNYTTYVDDIIIGSITPASSIFTGSISGFFLNVTTTPSSTIIIGSVLNGIGVITGTTITQQISGTLGGAGTYLVSLSQSITSESLTASWGILTVSVISQNKGPLVAGMLLTDGAANLIATGTTILEQISGTNGGIGTYAVSVSQSLASETLYAGIRIDLVQTELTVQVDVHGPNSGNNVKIIEALFFSEVAYDEMLTSGFDVHPLYCDDARQIPFINDQQQIEWRYSIDAHLQINPAINSWQQFANQVKVSIYPSSV